MAEPGDELSFLNENRRISVRCKFCSRSILIRPKLLGQVRKCPACSRATLLSEEIGVGDGNSDINFVRTNDVQSPDGTVLSGQSTPHASMPKALGRYQLLRLVGAGAYGEVWEADDKQLNRRVAIKLPTFSREDQKKTARFFREARTAAMLSHPNIMSVIDAGIFEDQLYLALEYLEGETLDRVFHGVQISEKRVVELMLKLAEAVAYAHRENVVHRDIKPQNIMLTNDEEIKLVDFGLAKVLCEDSGQTVDGTVLGTPAYMSPEQASGKTSELGPLSDQYSLGAVMYWMVAKQPPFDGIHSAVLTQVIHCEPKKLSSIRTGLDVRIEAICEKAMSKQPKDRYLSCEQFASDLSRVLRDEEIIARPLTAVQKIARWKRDRPVEVAICMISSLALILCVCASVIGFLRAETLAGEAKDTADAAYTKMIAAEKLAEATEAKLKESKEVEKRAQELRDKAAKKRKASEELTSKLAEATVEVDVLNGRVSASSTELSELKAKAMAVNVPEPLEGTGIGIADRVEVMDEISRNDPRKAMRLACQAVEQKDWVKASEWLDRVPLNFDPPWQNLLRTLMASRGSAIAVSQHTFIDRNFGNVPADYEGPKYLSHATSHGRISGQHKFLSTDIWNEVFWFGSQDKLFIVDARTLTVMSQAPRSLGDWIYLKTPNLLLNVADFEFSQGLARLGTEVAYANFHEKAELVIVVTRRISSNASVEEYTVRTLRTDDVNSKWQEHGRYSRNLLFSSSKGFKVIEFKLNDSPLEPLMAVRCPSVKMLTEPNRWNDLLISVDSNNSSIDVSPELNLDDALLADTSHTSAVDSGTTLLEDENGLRFRLVSPYSLSPVYVPITGLAKKQTHTASWIMSSDYLTLQTDSGFVRIDLLTREKE